MSIKLLKQGIQTRKPILFEYSRPDKVKGERRGSVFAVFYQGKKQERGGNDAL